jgi:hypothetical protein
MKNLICALLILFPSSLYAVEDPKKCLDLADSVMRLDCYDSYFRKLAQAQSDTAGEDVSPDAAAVSEVSQQEIVFDIATVVDLIENYEFKLAIEALRNNDITENGRATLVKLTLSKVKPLPASKTEQNMEGYALLNKLEPSNSGYKLKLDKYTNAAIAEKTKWFKKLKPRYDEFQSTTWYSHPNEPRYRNSRSSIYLYIGHKKGSRPKLRLVTQYTGDNWLFIERVMINIDGKVHVWTVGGYGKFERDNGGGGIWEWKDETPTAQQIALLKSITDAKSVTIRFDGQQYYNDKKMRKSDIKAIGEVLLAFDEMIEQGM